MTALIRANLVSRRMGLLLAALGPVLVLIYAFLGHDVLRAMYTSDLPLTRTIMEARDVTPIESYLLAADASVVDLGLCLVVMGLLVWLFCKNPLGLVFSGVSSLVCTVALFVVLNSSPGLVRALHFDIIPYFALRLNRVPDAVLGYREKPFLKYQIDNFRGWAFSPLYGIDVPPTTVRWETDGDGFRNSGERSTADVAVIGSSFGEYGTDFETTFPRQLEIKLGGPRVVNFSKGSYGPFEYLEVLRRYTVARGVRYVLILCYPSSDMGSELEYWQESGNTYGTDASGGQVGLMSRYEMAVAQAGEIVLSSAKTAFQLALMDTAAFVHPDVAVLRLPSGPKREVVFLDRHSAGSADELLHSPVWRAWQRIMVALREISEDHSIIPVLVYIPTGTEIYAQYSTQESGANWLRARDALVASRHSSEEAARVLATEASIPMISVLPAFERAAREGKLIYYPLDSHWTDEGAAIAASVVADAFKQMRAQPLDGGRSPDASQARLLDADGQSGVFERTLDGRIKSWNRQAEALYGWTKDEAIGKVSHELLRTQFPESLEQINDSVLQYGRWDGVLVHATRDGRRVEVMSHWIWDPKTELGDIIEINKQSANF